MNVKVNWFLHKAIKNAYVWTYVFVVFCKMQQTERERESTNYFGTQIVHDS
jgi:hypothetical protein